MKTRILIIGIDATPARLLGDEGLTNVRRLMEAGAYGAFEGDDAAAETCDALTQAGMRLASIAAGSNAGAVREIADAADLLDSPGCDALFVAATAADLPRFDAGLGGLLERVGEETSVLLVSDAGAFVLAGPCVPPVGVLEAASALDVVATWLALAGVGPDDAPDSRLLLDLAATLSPSAGLDANDMASVLERLSGLGYI